ncbi:MAG TPA: bacillithiol biosynthesis deacetylase BshB1 [Gemmatimonadales bacterium]|jgi:bacillithiol biosynthesis deacetylase BshB1
MTVDLLAIMAHPDDAELLCGGTLIRAVDQGHRAAVLDLTRGELGSRGTPELRAEEAARSSEIMGLSERVNAGLPDGHLANNDATRRAVVEQLRRLRPRTVIVQYSEGRHPDHRIASELARDACFLSGLANYPGSGERFRPSKICFAISFREDQVKPSFVVDISDQMERKLAAVQAFTSQFTGVTQAGELHPTGQPLVDLIATQNAHYGSLIRTRYAEPFWTRETVAVDDIVTMGVAT